MTPQGTYNKEKRRNHGYQAQKTNKPTTGGWEGGQAQRTATRKLKNYRYNASCDLDPLHTLAPRLPDVCEKSVFRFIRSSASGKQH